MEKKLQESIISSLASRIIIAIDEKTNCQRKIHAKTRYTNSYTSKILNILAEENIIIKLKKKRQNYVELTETGIEIRKHLTEINKIIAV